MSTSGYKRKSGPCRRYVCFAPDSRHSRADVRFRVDFVCFTPSFGRSHGLRWTSAYDPKRKSECERETRICSHPGVRASPLETAPARDSLTQLSPPQGRGVGLPVAHLLGEEAVAERQYGTGPPALNQVSPRPTSPASVWSLSQIRFGRPAGRNGSSLVMRMASSSPLFFARGASRKCATATSEEKEPLCRTWFCNIDFLV